MRASSVIKITFASIMLVIAAFIFIGILAMPEDELGINSTMMYLALVLAASSFGLIYSAVSSEKKKAPVKSAYISYMTPAELQELQCGNLPRITDVPVILGAGEVAHYFAPACRYITKTKAVGRTGGHGGASIRIAKGVSVHTGRTAGQTIYGNVTDTFDGKIVLTNRRLVFISQQNGFDLKLSSISAIVPGALILIQSGSKSYMMDIAQPEYFGLAISIALDAEASV